MDGLTAFFTSMLALSIGVERIVEILKQMIPPLRKAIDPRTDPEGTKQYWRNATLQFLACLVGGGLAAAIGPGVFLPSLGIHPIAGPVLLGVMASGGSALWNHALDIVGAIKDVRESVAKQAQAQTAQTQRAVVTDVPIGP